jgi:hypothetical protein
LTPRRRRMENWCASFPQVLLFPSWPFKLESRNKTE